MQTNWTTTKTNHGKAGESLLGSTSSVTVSFKDGRIVNADKLREDAEAKSSQKRYTRVEKARDEKEAQALLPGQIPFQRQSTKPPARSMELLPELESLSPMSSMAWTERDITALSSKKRDSRLPSDPNSRKASRRLSVSSAGINRSEGTSQQSRLIATLSELEQQASSWRNSNRSYRSNLKHSENSKATGIENTSPTFRFYNWERETIQDSVQSYALPSIYVHQLINYQSCLRRRKRRGKKSEGKTVTEYHLHPRKVVWILITREIDERTRCVASLLSQTGFRTA